MFHRNIRLPGVYMFNNTTGATPGMQGAPIFSTMDNLGILGMNDASDKVLVFPKYRVYFYQSINFGGTSLDISNNGTKCIYKDVILSSGIASSCKGYYDNEEILNVFSTTGN